MENKKEYYTKSELASKWSNFLIEKYFPKCSLEKTNPHYKCASPMQLYDAKKVKRIESRVTFKADMEKVMRRKLAALERAEKKRNELMKQANAISINIPTMEKDKLIENACYHYNNWNEWKECEYGNFTKATPSSDKEFLKRITINYLRHQCTSYDNTLRKFYKKVGVQEAHDILQDRINNAIKEKYEWLR